MIKEIRFYDDAETYISIEDSNGGEEFYIEMGITDDSRRTLQLQMNREEIIAVINSMNEIVKDK